MFGVFAQLPALAPAPPVPSRFEAPFPVIAGQGWVEGVYPSPSIYDWDGDGRPDLLVGTTDASCGARLKIYRNVGRLGEPRFEWLEDFNVGGVVPRVPGG